MACLLADPWVRNMRKWLVYILFFLPAFAAANELCPAEKTTREIGDCLVEKVREAESVLKQYLDAAKTRYEDDPEMVRLIEVSQSAWVKYRKAHCDAVYQEWAEGTIRFINHPYCMLYTTRSRTYDVWREFLTYQDSTEPILPEPQLLPYKK